ncbi:hypothetical protein HY634_04505 [Candidatus Uhrbacteria bacterium]|nr:hypothetical protein [Candidatus Uhrbacteria bacterium]
MPRTNKPKKPGRRGRSGGTTKVRIELPSYTELVAVIPALTAAIRELSVTTARLEQQIARATERFAAMRR